MIATLNKGAYQLSLDGKKLKLTINENLLKLYYDKINYELIIIVEYKNL